MSNASCDNIAQLHDKWILLANCSFSRKYLAGIGAAHRSKSLGKGCWDLGLSLRWAREADRQLNDEDRRSLQTRRWWIATRLGKISLAAGRAFALIWANFGWIVAGGSLCHTKHQADNCFANLWVNSCNWSYVMLWKWSILGDLPGVQAIIWIIV